MLSPVEAEIVRRDPDVPGLATVLDPEALAAVLPIDARSARLEYVRYKPHVLCRAAYRLDGEFFIDVRACRPEDFTAAGEIVLNDRAVAVNVFPNDAELPSLRPLMDAANGTI